MGPGESSKVRRFWETDKNALLWKYGNDLKSATPDEAMQLWEDMIQKGLPLDTTAKNLYIDALKKGGDRKYQQEIERIQNLKFFNVCLINNAYNSVSNILASTNHISPHSLLSTVLVVT